MTVAVRSLVFAVLVGAVLAVVILRADPGVRPRAGLPAGTATVVRTIDGDTVDLDFGAGPVRARLLGIDTPETVDERRPVQCYGPEASARLHELLPNGTAVRVERDVEARDAYQRLLVYLYRAADDLFVNKTMISEGLANTLAIEPNHAHRTDFEIALIEAKRRGAGLWSACSSFGANRNAS